MIGQNNIIRKAAVNFKFTGDLDAITMQQQASDWCRTVLNASLSSALEEYEQGEEIHQLNKIDLEIDLENIKDWNTDLADKIIFHLKEKLHNVIREKEKPLKISAVANDYARVFAYYLNSGILPWYCSITNAAQLKQQFKQWVRDVPASEIKELLRQIPEEKWAGRVMELLEGNDLEIMIAHIREMKVNELEEIMREIRVISRQVIIKGSLQQKLIRSFVQILLTGIELEMAVDKWIGQLFINYPDQFVLTKTAELRNTYLKNKVEQLQLSQAQGLKNQEKKKQGDRDESLLTSSNASDAISVGKENRDQSSIAEESAEVRNRKEIHDKSGPEINESERLNRTEGEKRNDTELIGGPFEKKEIESILLIELAEGIFINNAGAVIIAPFLFPLFEKTGLLKDNEILEAGTAISLLHYCVTGNTNPMEYELFLLKILCGVVPDYVFQAEHDLDKGLLKEADELLSSVIEHWSIIKNTSIEGLRESFLKRNGKLSFVNDTWVLQVEQKPYDMVLTKIPWNISMIKLPWMKYRLNTEWT